MSKDKNTRSAEQPNTTQSLDQLATVVGSGTESQLQNSATRYSVQSTGGNHKVLKAYLIASLVILILNTCLLLLTLIPFAGVYVAIGAAPILLATGLLGLLNLLVVSRSLSKKYFTDNFRKVQMILLTLSAIAVLGGMSSPFTLAIEHKENTKTQKIREKEKNAQSEASVERATQLLNSCEVYQVRYDNPGETLADITSTGILLYEAPTKYGAPSPTGTGWTGGTYTMYVTSKATTTVLPIARQAQHTCGIQFSHDGTDEQWKDGHWYFRDNLVK